MSSAVTPWQETRGEHRPTAAAAGAPVGLLGMGAVGVRLTKGCGEASASPRLSPTAIARQKCCPGPILSTAKLFATSQFS